MKKINKKNISKFLITIIICCIISTIIVYIIGIKIKPTLLEIAQFEAEKIESTIINKSINKIIDDNYEINNLFHTIKNKNDEIQMTDFNTLQVNKLLNHITMNIQNNLKTIEDGNFEDLGINSIKWNLEKNIYLKKGIIIGIPIGIVTAIPFLTEIGPIIPIKIHYLGDVNSNIYTKINEYGINSALMEIGVKVELSAKILLPFTTKRISLSSEVPISIKLIQGKIPNYYGNEIMQNSHLYSIPIN